MSPSYKRRVNEQLPLFQEPWIPELSLLITDAITLGLEAITYKIKGWVRQNDHLYLCIPSALQMRGLKIIAIS